MIRAAYAFLRYLESVKQASPHTLRNYAADLNALKEHLDNAQKPSPRIHFLNTNPTDALPKDTPLPLNKISRATLRGFLAEMNTQGLSKRSIVRRLSTLRSFLSYAHAQKWIPTNPAAELERPKIDKKLPSFLSYEQTAHLLSQPDTHTPLGVRDRAILELLYSSGLRISELVSLNVHDLDLTQQQLKARGKGKKERLLPVTPCALEWITTYLNHPKRPPPKEEHALFLNRFGTRLTARSIARTLHKYLLSSGLSATVTPHTLRHSIASEWLNRGMNLKTIQLLLGHSSPTTTTLYTQVSKDLKKKVFDQAHPRAGKE